MRQYNKQFKQELQHRIDRAEQTLEQLAGYDAFYAAHVFEQLSGVYVDSEMFADHVFLCFMLEYVRDYLASQEVNNGLTINSKEQK
jgi:uncharacterized MAPEG superfamily protein